MLGVVSLLEGVAIYLVNEFFSICIRNTEQKCLTSHGIENSTFLVLLQGYVNPSALCFNIA